MKKSIVYLGVALISFANFSFASNSNNSTTEKTIVVEAFESISPLNISIYKGDVETIKKLIKYGADVNEKSNGMTPLMFAARYNKLEVMKILLSNGANLDVKDIKGFNVLQHAEFSNAIAVVQYLKKV